MRNNRVLRLTLSALFLALGILLPFLTGNNRQLGNIMSLMHIPVLLCGFVCGWKFGLAVGFVTPLLRSLIVGMPPMLPIALGMAFELAAYGALAGLLYKELPKTITGLYLALILSMLGGRLVWGLASYIIYSSMGNPFTLSMFWAAAFVTPIPGILFHIAIIPPILLALKEYKMFPLTQQ
ncbi:MAG: ECF transporter S component [Christensenellales bacterium]|jgi:thiamine transporter ThiT|nr:ECF transporter S component [Desulfovibrionales bacterium]HHT06896.1 ECF transporter S component [Clostridiales bacterium]